LLVIRPSATQYIAVQAMVMPRHLGSIKANPLTPHPAAPDLRPDGPNPPLDGRRMSGLTHWRLITI